MSLVQFSEAALPLVEETTGRLRIGYWKMCCGLTLEDHVRNRDIREIMKV